MKNLMEIKNSKINTNNKIMVTPKEYCRISYELTEDDFSTLYSNPARIGKMVNGIEKYITYKRNNIKKYI